MCARMIPIAYTHDTQGPCSLVLGRRQALLYCHLGTFLGPPVATQVRY